MDRAVARGVCRLQPCRMMPLREGLANSGVSRITIAPSPTVTSRQLSGPFERPHASPAVKLAFRDAGALTACRSGEVRGMIWDEVDLQDATWTIPGERMKSREVPPRAALPPGARNPGRGRQLE